MAVDNLQMTNKLVEMKKKTWQCALSENWDDGRSVQAWTEVEDEFQKVGGAKERTCPLDVLCLVLHMVRRLKMEGTKAVEG